MQVSHSHCVELILNLSPNPEKDVSATGLAGAGVGAAFCAFGLGVSHAAQMVLSFEFVMQHTEQVHDSVGGLNLSPNPTLAVTGARPTGATDVVVDVFGVSAFEGASFRKMSITLPDFNSLVGFTWEGGKSVSISIGFFSSTFSSSVAAGLTYKGELKLNVKDFEVLAATAAAAAADGLTVTSGAANVKVGRASVFSLAALCPLNAGVPGIDGAEGLTGEAVDFNSDEG